ncbi:type II secretion system F family protein [Methanonatronarchaeum sp. AMET-Sl]|uniref:type II secretion system F family protein n=1 Tax=Methanonatronarchaeum sp. AMET-Sl TaxID=3037654 RepID=UPI00244DE3EA|nr:type II secretion system F family protein [Methanonatronarchaeum sp. AMET-Sl]WGI16836.1 type II secretion system F family protein [Methanonatronarchaeum sp. AMET-Sl]
MKLKKVLKIVLNRYKQFLSKHIDHDELSLQLKSARLSITPEKLVTTAFLSTTIILLIGIIGSLFLLTDIYIVVGIITTALLGLITGLFILYYPKLLIDGRKRRININMGSAVTFMYALSKGGMDIEDIFRRLAMHEEAYGEISKEAKLITTEMDFFSKDIQEAIKECIQVTPSQKFKDFLTDMLPVIRAGGDLPNYLENKSKEYLKDSLEEQKTYITFLGYISEAYVAGFVAGPLVIILGVVILGLSFGAFPVELTYSIYLLLPLGGFFFIILLKTVAPEKEKSIREEDYDKFTQKFEGMNQNNLKGEVGFKTSLRDKIDKTGWALRSEPIKTLYFSIPLSLLYLTYVLAINGFYYFVQTIELQAVLIALFLFLPMSIFYELEARRRQKIESQFPDLLRMFSSLNRTGMSLKATIKQISEVPGIIGREVSRVRRGIEWNLSVREALARFAFRMKNKEVLRSIILILEGTRAHSQVSTVLNVATEDINNRRILNQRLRRDIVPYIALVWLSFLIFLFTAAILSTQFLAEMPLAEEMEDVGQIEFGFDKEELEMMETLIFHSALLMGFVSGLVAGQLSKGTMYSGIKHALLMLLIGYIMFTFIF